MRMDQLRMDQLGVDLHGADLRNTEFCKMKRGFFVVLWNISTYICCFEYIDLEYGDFDYVDSSVRWT